MNVIQKSRNVMHSVYHVNVFDDAFDSVLVNVRNFDFILKHETREKYVWVNVPVSVVTI
jgi:hypothetical protein